jgi:tetrahydromethanopterin S-methyltransferase subunit B
VDGRKSIEKLDEKEGNMSYIVDVGAVVPLDEFPERDSLEVDVFYLNFFWEVLLGEMFSNLEIVCQEGIR